MAFDNKTSTRTAFPLSRRTFLRGTAATALSMPFVMRAGDALSSSGNLRIAAWAGYVSPEMLAAFEKATGIKATYTAYGTNDEILNLMKVNQGQGFDVIWPALDRVPNWPCRPEAAIWANSQNVVGTRRGGLTREVPGRDIALQFEERFNEYGYFEFGYCRPMELELRRH